MIDKKVLRELVQRKFVNHEGAQVDTEIMALSEKLADELTMPELEILLDTITMPLFKYILSRNDAQQAYDSEFATDMRLYVKCWGLMMLFSFGSKQIHSACSCFLCL